MASLVLGAAGAFVGNMILPGIGGTVGWAIGSSVGGALFGPSREGPRLTDKRLQTSSFGQGITVLYGTDRLAGNVIFQTDLKEEKHKSGGKGGPKITTYTYSASFAIGLCKGPIKGVKRIWADSRLVWGPGADSSKFPFKLYLGDETQLADPTQEAVLGAGNVPAYRGLAYAQFTDLPLGEFGNRLPMLTFEVQQAGDMHLEVYDQWPVDWRYPVDGSNYGQPPRLHGVEAIGDGTTFRLHRYRQGRDYVPPVSESDDGTIYYDQRTYDLHGNLLSSATQVAYSPGIYISVNGCMNSGIAVMFQNHTIDCRAYGKAQYTDVNTSRWMLNGIVTWQPDPPVLENDYFCMIATESQIGLGNWSASRTLPVEGRFVYWNGYVYAAGHSGADLIIRRWPTIDGAVCTGTPDIVGFNADAVRTGYPASNCVADAGVIVVGDDGYLYWNVSYHSGTDDGLRLFKLDAELNLVQSWWDDSGAGPNVPEPAFGGFIVRQGHLIAPYNSGIYNLSGNYILYRLESNGTFTWVDEMPLLDNGPLVTLNNGFGVVGAGIITLGSTGITLAEIVSAISVEAGLTTGDIDVTELTDVVWGYKVSSQVTCRAAIEALQPAYFFDAVESDAKVKFPKRKGVSVATIPDDDLGAHEGGTQPVALIFGDRMQEADLPALINVNYINVAADYQDGTQFERRQATTSQLAATVNCPIPLEDEEAKHIAQVLMFNSWLERERYTLSVPRKWAHLEPTDVVTAQGHVLRLVNKDETQKNIIRFNAVRTRADIWVQAPVPTPATTYLPGGGAGGFVPPDVSANQLARLLLLDIPLIHDTDAATGFYVAMGGSLDDYTWIGGGSYRSIDGGSNYNLLLSVADGAITGHATTILGNFTGGNIFDESNTVTVLLNGSNTLESSNTAGVLNGANGALLDNEIIQFRTATLVGTRTYTLSGLLRGRRGTEWAIGLHGAVGAGRFVMLDESVLRSASLYSDLGISYKYKGVTSGGSLASATAQDFTNTGVSLLPYAPVQLGGGRNAAGDVTLTWVRRTRIGGAWTDNVDVPLSEPQEYYAIGIYNSTYATFKRWLFASNQQSVIYTVADQTTDFGGAQTTVYFTVQQWGGYGYGYAARGAI